MNPARCDMDAAFGCARAFALARAGKNLYDGIFYLLDFRLP